jgi:uncharacterized protein YodC (DUF2158 family)
MEFAPGDIVQLKSGGPRMTVAQVGSDSMTGEAFICCTWFEQIGRQQVLQKEMFNPYTLDKATASPGVRTIRVQRG